MKALVTGGTGFIGSHLVEALVQRGYEVICLVRQTSNLQWLKTLPVKCVYGNLLNKASLLPLVKDVDFVYHVAGLTKSPDKTGYYQANFSATKNLIELVAQVRPDLKRFVHISSLAAVGPSHNGGIVTEDTPCQPITDYGRSKLKGEEAVRTYLAALPITIIRPPVVYGPRDKDLFLYFKALRYGIKPLIGIKKHISIIHVQDLVEGIIQAGENPDAAAKTYFMANDESCTMDYLSDLVRLSIKRSVITLRVPDSLVYFLAGISEYVAWLSGKTTIFNRQKAREIAQPAWVCNNHRAKNELGFKTGIPIEQGIKQTAEWYYRNNWLQN
jgi:nucleoside-diphosphate-sugar epimerase